MARNLHALEESCATVSDCMLHACVFGHAMMPAVGRTKTFGGTDEIVYAKSLNVRKVCAGEVM